jgi:hypothetical protein
MCPGRQKPSVQHEWYLGGFGNWGSRWFSPEIATENYNEAEMTV